MTNLDVLELAALLNDKDNDQTAALKLRRGVVESVNLGSATAKVAIGGVSVDDIPFHRHAVPNVADVVDLLFDGPSPRIIGVLGQSLLPRRLGYAISAPSGSDQTLAITTLAQFLGSIFSAPQLGPVPANRVLQFEFALWAHLHSALSEIYFQLYTSEGSGGAKTMVGEVRHSWLIDASPSPRGSILFKSGAGWSNLTLWLRCYALRGTGTLYYQHATTTAFNSRWILTDTGPI